MFVDPQARCGQARDGTLSSIVPARFDFVEFHRGVEPLGSLGRRRGPFFEGCAGVGGVPGGAEGLQISRNRAPTALEEPRQEGSIPSVGVDEKERGEAPLDLSQAGVAGTLRRILDESGLEAGDRLLLPRQAGSSISVSFASRKGAKSLDS